jgi:hypothetical protein
MSSGALLAPDIDQLLAPGGLTLLFAPGGLVPPERKFRLLPDKPAGSRPDVF